MSTARSREGMVCSPHHLATRAGVEVLENGGNAFDVCVAVNAVLQVVYPVMCHLGGDGFWMCWLAHEGRLMGLNGSGRSGAAASAGALRRAGYETMPQTGPLTITVPGCVDGWVELLGRCGSRDLAELLAPAERLAREGFPVTAKLAVWMAGFADTADDGWREIFMPTGSLPGAGDLLRQEALASTYRTIMAGGREVFYRGELAEALAGRVQALGGNLTTADFARHRAEWVEPVRSSYRGVELFEMPPNSQGTTAQLILNLVEGWGNPGGGDAGRVDTLLRAAAVAYRERDLELADPERMTSPPDILAQPATAARLAPALESVLPGPRLDGDTCYFCAVDREGNCCSAIQSLYRGWVAGVDPATGVHFQSRGAFFSLEPGHRNELAPGVRTLHTLMPAMAFREGRPWLVFGTMGGNAQAQIHSQLLGNRIDLGMSPGDAVAAPRWTLGEPGSPAGSINLERGAEGLVDGLRARGWVPEVLDYGDPFGHSHMIELRDGWLEGAADPRADSLAAGPG